jgi:hypothetical protein
MMVRYVIHARFMNYLVLSQSNYSLPRLVKLRVSLSLHCSLLVHIPSGALDLPRIRDLRMGHTCGTLRNPTAVWVM